MRFYQNPEICATLACKRLSLRAFVCSHVRVFPPPPPACGLALTDSRVRCWNQVHVYALLACYALAQIFEGPAPDGFIKITDLVKAIQTYSSQPLTEEQIAELMSQVCEADVNM